MPFAPDTTAGLFEVVRGSNTLTLPAPWCKVTTLAPLSFPGPQRNTEGITRPGVTGRRSRRREYDGAEHELELTLAGDVLYSGSTPASHREGMEANLAWLLSFCAPVTSSPYTLTATLTKASGDEFTAGVQLELLGGDDIWSSWGRCTLVVYVPAGPFTFVPPPPP
jgi:hypothetical protein